MPISWMPEGAPNLAEIYIRQQQMGQESQMAAARLAEQGREHNQSMGMQAAALRQRADEFQQSRQVSGRDLWGQQADLEKQQQHVQLQAWLNDTQLSQAEQIRLQRVKNGQAEIDGMLADGRIDEETHTEMSSQLAGIGSPLAARHAQAQVQMQQQQIQQQEEEEKRQAGIRSSVAIADHQLMVQSLARFGVQRLHDPNNPNQFLPGLWQMDRRTGQWQPFLEGGRGTTGNAELQQKDYHTMVTDVESAVDRAIGHSTGPNAVPLPQNEDGTTMNRNQMIADALRRRGLGASWGQHVAATQAGRGGTGGATGPGGSPLPGTFEEGRGTPDQNSVITNLDALSVNVGNVSSIPEDRRRSLQEAITTARRNFMQAGSLQNMTPEQRQQYSQALSMAQTHLPASQLRGQPSTSSEALHPNISHASMIRAGARIEDMMHEAGTGFSGFMQRLAGNAGMPTAIRRMQEMHRILWHARQGRRTLSNAEHSRYEELRHQISENDPNQEQNQDFHNSLSLTE